MSYLSVERKLWEPGWARGSADLAAAPPERGPDPCTEEVVGSVLLHYEQEISWAQALAAQITQGKWAENLQINNNK